MKFTPKTKSRFFVFESYDIDNLDNILNELNDDFMRYAYIIHDKDENKPHIHFLLDYGQFTTVRHILSCYEHLAANGFIKPSFAADKYYKYMYHDQSIESAKGKHVYPEENVICMNGFDKDDLHTYTENERMIFMDCIMSIANNQQIYEYAGLLEYLSQNERDLYLFAMNNTILVNGYMHSHRNRYKKVSNNNN